MQRPGGTVELALYCDGCGDSVKIGVATTPDGSSAGVHIKQHVFNVVGMTAHGDRVYCYNCEAREKRQLDLLKADG